MTGEAGAGAASGSGRASGFTLVGVVVAIAILTILIAAIGPSIATVMQRDKEIELIFRGKQYARAILAFQKRYGRYPLELKELAEIKPRSIRQLWKEPMCNCEEGWTPIIAGTPDALPMGQGPPPPGGGMPGSGFQRTPRPGQGGPNQPPSTYTGIGGQPTPSFLGGGAPVPTPTVKPFSTGIFGDKTKTTTGPIVGVKIALHKKAIRKWRDHEFYDEWRFIAGDADNDLSNPIDPNTLRGVQRLTPSPGVP